MIDRKQLLADLRGEVTRLEGGLREQVGAVEGLEQRLRDEHAAATKARRTSATWTSWRDEQVTQAAVAWVLGTVFVRWCEDNELIDPLLSGPGERLGAAEDAQLAYFRREPHRTDADWLRSGFDVLAASDAGAMLFDARHNPAYLIAVSHDGAKALIAFWRTRRGDGSLVHDFRDPEWDTRFLGDLYQDLSDDAKDRYALLQTPEFVEEFILDLTLTPAIEEFGLDGLRVIDPTCGSGHFLLGTFHRLVDAWRERAPSLEPYELARRALDSVHGVDVNPFAVAISRFRLLVAAWRAAGVSTVTRGAGQHWRMAVATGDSLLPVERQRSFAEVDEQLEYHAPFEDVHEFHGERLLDPGSYHAVVGNPPYIKIDDNALNNHYREIHSDVCSGKYTLSVPFVKVFLNLCWRQQTTPAGFMGQITANGFLKRQFGKRLITSYLPSVDLTHIVDTSGIPIPGSGVTTVMLFGRNRPPVRDAVHTVQGVRGEPSSAPGPAWRSILAAVADPSYDSQWVTSADTPRSVLAVHPWSLSGGGAAETLELMRINGQELGELGVDIGMTALPGEDEAYIVSANSPLGRQLAAESSPIVVGDEVRDYMIKPGDRCILPVYFDGSSRHLSNYANAHLWRYRNLLAARRYFGKTPSERGLKWHDLAIFFPKRHRTGLAISFASLATHNHFAFSTSCEVFKQSAPALKMPPGSAREDYLLLLAVLNSSAACFWFRETCHSYGSGAGKDGQRQATIQWESFLDFASKKVDQLRIPRCAFPRSLSNLGLLAEELKSALPETVLVASMNVPCQLSTAKETYNQICAKLIAQQEEADWIIYHSYGLLSKAEAAEVVLDDPAEAPELALGERAFEIVLARRMAEGKVETQWFARHGSTPITELPNHWPDKYREVVEKRIELIERRRDLALIERPECKRRWNTEPWDKQQERALRGWLLDRLEARELWFAPDVNGEQQPAPRSVHSLADALRGDADFTDVAALWAADALDTRDADLADIVGELVDGEHVPFLAAYRYKGKGFDKRADWEHVWELQRAEDRIADRLGHDVTHPEVRRAVERELGTIPVPPKYGSPDFARTEYWRHRGKLDVPKERFVSYPNATREGDGSLLLGWAGWDHREQAQSLAVLATQRRTEDGWDRDRLVPLLAGLAELQPWVAQWHGEFDPAFGSSPAELYEGFLDGQLTELHLSRDDLASWRPTGRVDVAPLPRRRATRGTATATAPRTRRQSAGPDPEHLTAVLDAAASGPLSNEQVRTLTGLDTTGARKVLQHLVERGDLVQTGQRRGARYQRTTGATR
jgi:hypothetical protein